MVFLIPPSSRQQIASPSPNMVTVKKCKQSCDLRALESLFVKQCTTKLCILHTHTHTDISVVDAVLMRLSAN